MKYPENMAGFICFLNRNYYISSHLSERLDELKGMIIFARYSDRIEESIAKLEIYTGRLDQMFDLLDSASSYDDCEPLIIFLEDIFNNVRAQKVDNPTIALLDYIAVADVLMCENARLAELAAAHTQQTNVQLQNLYDPTILGTLKAALREAFIAV